MILIFLGWGLILLGLFFLGSGVIGLWRFPDFYSRIHAAGVIESCGNPLILVGLAFLQANWTASFKLLFIALLIFCLSPVSTYALGRAATINHLK